MLNLNNLYKYRSFLLVLLSGYNTAYFLAWLTPVLAGFLTIIMVVLYILIQYYPKYALGLLLLNMGLAAMITIKLLLPVITILLITLGLFGIVFMISKKKTKGL